MPGREQDASPTIRGFVYQADLTLIRWLGLGPRQSLQLECGEDIDQVTRAAGATGSEKSRLLEQVKDVKRPLTLGSASARAALSAFCAHRAANPTLDLWFRFTTTARSGRETRSPLPKAMTGIEAWERLRRSELTAPGARDLLAGVRALLARAGRPESATPEAWSALQHVASATSDDELFAFVQRVEWSVGAPSLSVTSGELVETIRRRCGVATAQAEVLHDRLFAQVFRVLSRPGPKVLMTDQLDQIAASPVLSEDDRWLLQTLHDSCLRQDLRLLSLESRVDQLEQRHLQGMAAIAEVSAELVQANDIPILEAPPLVRQLAERRATIARELRECDGATWIAITGGVGTGKSHLAGLVAKAASARMLWLSLRDLDGAGFVARVRATLMRRLRRVWPGAVLDHIPAWRAWTPEGSSLVFDDLPALDAGSAPAAFWTELLGICSRAGVRVISTSVHRPAPSLLDSVAVAPARHRPVPPFGQDDVAEVLRAHEAPESMLTTERIGLLVAISRGHPALLLGAVRHLAQRSWRFDRDLLTSLFLGVHTDSIDVETTKRLVETVTRPECRELLYRLSLVGDALNIEEIGRVAQLAPARQPYLECVQNLDGLWLQPAGDSRYEVSPLVTKFGPKQLDVGVARAVHRCAADRILRRQELDLPDLFRAVTHLAGADEDTRAASLLLMAFSPARRPRAEASDRQWLLVFYPPTVPVPKGMQASIAAQLRTAQAIVCHEMNGDPGPYLASFRELADAAHEPDHWGILAASNQLFAGDTRLPLRDLLDAVSRIERLAGRAPTPWGEELRSPLWDEGGHAWLLVPRLGGWEDLWEWLTVVASLNPVRGRQIMSSSSAVDFLQPLVDRLTVAAAEGDSSAPALEQAKEQLRRLEEWARERGFDLLIAAAIRGQMVIAGEYQRRLDVVEKLGARALEILRASGPARSLIELTLGQQPEYAGKHAEALPRLRHAVREEAQLSQDNWIFGLLTAAEAAHSAGDPEAGDFAERAMRAFGDVRHPNPTLAARVGAEVGITRWLRGQRPEAFDALESAVTNVLGAAVTDQVKAHTVLIGHTLATYASVARTGSPPPSTQDGGPWLEPRPSMFRSSSKDALDRYRPRTARCILQAQLATLGGAVGRTERSLAWAESAYEEACDQGIPAAIVVMTPYVIDAQVAAGDYAAALETGLTACKAWAAEEAETRAGRDPDREEFAIDVRAFSVDPSRRAKLEQRAIEFVLLPMVLHILETRVEGQERTVAAARGIADVFTGMVAQATEASLWQSLSGLFSAVTQTAAGAELEAQAKDLAKEHAGSVQVAAYLLLSIHEATSLPVSAKLQCESASFCIQVLDGSGPRSAGRFALAIAELWRFRFEAARFRFKAPAVVGEKLHEAAALEPIPRMKMTMRAVIQSLDVGLSPGAREFIFN